MKSRSIRVFGVFTIVMVFACLWAAFAVAQNKPNFTGSWKMNPQKSKFTNGGPEGILIKIDHKDPEFVEDWSISTPNGERSFQAKYTIGGKETDQQVMGREAKTLAKWAG